MAKPNYAFEKRQRELAKKQKKEEKAARKASGVKDRDDPEPAGDEGAEDPTPAAPQPAAGAGPSN